MYQKIEPKVKKPSSMYGRDSRGRKQEIEDECVITFFNDNPEAGAAELQTYLAKKQMAIYKIDGVYKLIRNVERRSGKKLIPKHLNPGRPKLLTDEQVAELRTMYCDANKYKKSMTIADVQKFAEKKYGVKYSRIGFFNRFRDIE